MKKKKPKTKEMAKKGENEEEEALRLEREVQSFAPKRGEQRTIKEGEEEDLFENMPLSSRTKEGLRSSGLKTPTEIQAAALPHALAGRDILGAAKTGSGKTLCFVLPVLEKLFRERWSVSDGLAAIIVTPTRELALQIFEVLRSVGRKHQVSAGLVTGGKKELEEEQERVVGMNVLVATPGRLLQHLEQTPGFDASQLLMLVLDEADRILDMGFKDQLDSILSYLPPGGQRQTMLFSATQTKSVKQPEYLAVHATHTEATPTRLVQNYVVCRLHEKLDVLYSFIKSHLKNKIIVFLSSCSQVRFVYECLRGMQPGIPLMALHGKIKQEKRTLIYLDYSRKSAACLFATDIAARGLDFPDVDWVVQVDAPEDRAMYIHRVGRTARYTSGGRALLMLMPQEERLVLEELSGQKKSDKEREKDSKEVTVNNIPIKKLSLNPKRTVQVSNRASALIISNPEFRLLAKKCFVSYLKSLSLLAHRKHVYRWSPSELDAYATSLGLHQTPELPPQVREGAPSESDGKSKKNVNRSLEKLKAQIKAAKEEKRRLREEKLASSAAASSSEDEEESDLLVPKQQPTEAAEESSGAEEGVPSSDAAAAAIKATQRKKQRGLKIGLDGEARKSAGRRMLYDDDGNLVDPLASLSRTFEGSETATDKPDLDDSIALRVAKVKSKLDSARREDDLREKERLKEKRQKQKRKRANNETEVTLGGDVGDISGDEDDSGSDSSDDTDGSDSDGSESESSDASSGRPRKSAKLSKDELKAQEELVLKMMS